MMEVARDQKGGGMNNNINSLKSLEFINNYRTGESDPISEFYGPCLKRSSLYMRAVGYFRSSILQIIQEEILLFVRAGGRIRIICSHILHEKDLDALKEGYSNREKVLSKSILNEIEDLIKNPGADYHAKAFATLVALNVIDLKIALRPSPGIYHEKIGVFSDECGNMVCFKGSSNETLNAWHEDGNYESIAVFCSWANKSDNERVKEDKEHFEELWADGKKDIEVFDFPDAARLRLCEAAVDSFEDIDWSRFSKKRKKENGVPDKRKPWSHQKEAIKNWEINNYRGILEHATGSGKTFTALIALKSHLRMDGVGLILVPSSLLMKQWSNEVKQEIPDARILKAGDNNIKWKNRNILNSWISNDTGLGKRVVIATMRTASSDIFLKKFQNAEHLMLVADECHQSGSPENSKIYKIPAGKRLGLSATPQRFGDPEGTNKMVQYLGPVLEPVFTLKDAIEAGRLVGYEYFPCEVRLTMSEAEEWKKISKDIRNLVAKSKRNPDGSIIPSKRLDLMNIKRSRIAKKATEKANLANSILKKNYVEGQKWLIYCEDNEQLLEVLRKLKREGLSPLEYHTSMEGDPESTLLWYRRNGGILVSIRCLDEGIDIPDISHAIILASSKNPRQFIQRRGRVLRVAGESKYKAVIHDCIVIPEEGEVDDDFCNLINSELCRAIEFADSSLNSSAKITLLKIAIKMGLEISEIAKTGTEESNE